MATTALEVLMLDLVNAEREARGLQPLAMDASLAGAAEGHSEWMLAADRFSHTGAGGSSATQRMAAAGYDLNGSWGTAENIAWASLRGAPGYADEIQLLHDNLMNSPGHRANILDGNLREIGVGFEVGEFDGWQAAMVTQNFARSGSDVFLTGLVTQDADRDGAYDIGEGRGGFTVTAVNGQGQSFTTTSNAAGDYALELDPGTYEVTFSKPGMAGSTQTVTIGGRNVGLDLDTADRAAGPTRSVRTDTDGTKPWDKVITTFDASGERVGLAIVQDDGDVLRSTFEDGARKTWAFTDVSDSRSWFENSRTFDAAGRVASQLIEYDTGDTFERSFVNGTLRESVFTDVSDQRGWDTRVITYDRNGNETDRTFVPDDFV